jgi:hypothetical protein
VWTWRTLLTATYSRETRQEHVSFPVCSHGGLFTLKVGIRYVKVPIQPCLLIAGVSLGMVNCQSYGPTPRSVPYNNCVSETVCTSPLRSLPKLVLIMFQVLNSLAVAVALYPILVASSMHKVRHSPDLAVRDPTIPTVINVGVSNDLSKRDNPIPYSYSLLACIDEIDNWPVRVLNHQNTSWDGVSVTSCVNACWNSGPIDGPFGPHWIFAGLVNGTQCWCDNTINVNAQPVDQSRCDHTCINGPNENCGGSREYLMYTLGEILRGFILLLLIDYYKIKRISIHTPRTQMRSP